MIVIQDNSTQIENFAAQELATYINLMTDNKAGIVKSTSENAIYIGCLPDQIAPNEPNRIASELENLHDDGFIISIIENNVIIQGKTPRAVLYGVYDYLRMLGVRWYFPGKEHEFVPKRREVILDGVDLIESPDFDHRSIVIACRNSAFDEWTDFAAKAKLSAIHVHSDEDIDQLTQRFASRGLGFGLRRHFFGGKYPIVDEGELEANKALLLNYVRDLPAELNDFFLWPADIHLELHDDEQLSIPDVILDFTNEMLKALRTLRPEARMSFLDYWSTWGAPKVSRPVDGVFLEMAPMFRCFSHAITDPVCPINSKEIHPVIEDLLQIFAPEESHVLGYWLDASLFGRSRYETLAGRVPQFGEVIKQDVEYYRDKGIYGISTFAVGINKEYLSRFASPTIFQYPALLWDADADIGSELVNFCENYYGDRSLIHVFQMNEQIEPNDKDFANWQELADRFSQNKLIVEEVMEATTNDVHIARLGMLALELGHMCDWANGMSGAWTSGI